MYFFFSKKKISSFVANKELSPAGQGEQHPNNIGCDGILQSQRGIEVGQAFLLGDK